MAVRAKRWLDLIFVLIMLAFFAVAISKAASPFIYLDRCSGRSGWLCDLAQSWQGHEVFGLNPVYLLSSLFFLAFLPLSIRRIWTGCAARLDGDELSAPAMYSTKRMKLYEIENFEIRNKSLNLANQLIVYSKDGRRLYVSNCIESDLNKLVARLMVTPPASPATPPAT